MKWNAGADSILHTLYKVQKWLKLKCKTEWDWTKLKETKRDWIRLNETEQDWTRLNKTEQDWKRLNKTEED